MPRERPLPPEPAGPGAAADLSAALNASGFGLGTLFTVRGDRMRDPAVLRTAEAMSRPSRAPEPRQSDAPAAPVVSPTSSALDSLRQRVDLFNKRFHDLSSDLARIDDGLRDVIFAHLEEIRQSDLSKSQNK